MNEIREHLPGLSVGNHACRVSWDSHRCFRVTRTGLILLMLICLGVQTGRAQQPQMAGEQAPLLKLQSQAPISQVTALGFSPDGGNLYATGWDKVVHVWSWDGDGERFTPNPAAAYRVNIGPGMSGTLNSLAVSADGRWLAVAGQQVTAAITGFREHGFVRPRSSFTQDEFREEGLIYVYNTLTRELKILRGHVGKVAGLSFSPGIGSTHLVALAMETGESGAMLGRVRVWDVATGGLAVQKPWELPTPVKESWPALAVQQMAPGLPGLFVAVAWGDHRLRIWNAGTHESTDRSLLNCFTCAFRPGSANLLVGEWPNSQKWGLLGEWNISRQAGGHLRNPDSVRQSRRLSVRLNQLPVALSLFSSKADSAVDHAAIAVYRLEPTSSRKRYELVIMNLATGEVITGSIPLGDNKRPCLAVSAARRRLAVYPDVNGRVAIHKLDDLLSDVNQPDDLNPEGIEVRTVAFAKNAGNDKNSPADWGLFLSAEQPGIPVGAVRKPVLNLSQGQMSLDRTGWLQDRPAVQRGWNAEVGKDNSVIVASPTNSKRIIPLAPVGETHRHIVFALMPPVIPNQTPLLAVASDWQGEQVLSLYDAGTGKRLRRCTAHSEPVTSLAFSSDGKRLVSAAKDRTVCVWWLQDLADNVGKRGFFNGLGVHAGAPQQLVFDLTPEVAQQPARAQLKTGDRLLGVVEGGKTVPFESAHQFYDYVSTRTPGTTLRLATSRNGAVPRSVDLLIEQAVDERKPLFTLFQTSRGENEAPSWIAWNPQGPFQSSDPRIESLVGWHFNTNRDSAPPDFSEIGKYRKTYYGEGLLNALMENGTVPAQWPPLPVAPQVSIGILPDQGEVIAPDREEHVLVRSWQARGLVKVQGFERNEISGVVWKLESPDPVRATEDVPLAGSMEFDPQLGMWTVDLSPLNLPRGIYRLVTTVSPTNPDIPPTTERQVVRYQPPAPTITLDDFRESPVKQVAEAKFQFKAQVDPTQNEPVTIALQISGANEKQKTDVKLPPGNRIDQELELTPGPNGIELVAVNTNALTGYEIHETTRTDARLRVVYMTPGAPEVSLTELFSNGRKIELKIPTEVTSSELRLRGNAVAPDGAKLAFCKIVVSSLDTGAKEKALPHVIDLPEAAGQAKFSIDRLLTLQPGEQSIRLMAGTVGGNEEIPAVRVVFRPPLPQLTVLKPNITKFSYAGEAQRFIRLQAKVTDNNETDAGNKVPWSATILINDQPVLVGKQRLKPEFDMATQTLSADVPLQAGQQSIRWQLSNSWRSSSPQPAVQVEYLRVPRVLQVTGPQSTDQPHVTLQAMIDVPPEFQLEKRMVLVNGKSPSADVIALEPVPVTPPLKLGLWKVTLSGLPLSQKINKFDITAKTASGAGVSKLHSVSLMEPPPKKPIIELAGTPTETWSDSELIVPFKVGSVDRLQRVEVRVKGRPPLTLDPLAKNLEYSPEIPLTPGRNDIEVHVETVRGGVSSNSFHVSHVPRPIRIEIDHVDWDQASLKPRDNTGSQVLFPKPVSAAVVEIHGRLTWDERASPESGTRPVKAWVNGFLQSSNNSVNITSKKGLKGSAEFVIKTVLNRKSNTINLEFPLTPTDAVTSRSIQLETDRPRTDQKLHLMLVGLDAKSEDELGAKFRDVFAIDAANEVSKHAQIEMILARDKVRSGLIKAGLLNYSVLIGSSRDDPLNHVLLVYYQGREVSKGGGFVLMDWKHREYDVAHRKESDDALRRDSGAIDSEYLENYFRETRGAHLIFLDVLSDKSSRNVDSQTHLGVLRYSEQDANAAQQPPLLPGALGQAVPKNNRFRAVANEVGVFLKSQVGGNTARLDSHVPSGLADLVLGRP